MNDDLMAAARDCFGGIHMTVAEQQIISRGRAVRARRHRSRLAAGALAGLAACALAVTALLPAGQPGTSSIRLDAWTVKKEANNSVHVTIRQLRDPARLQATLRADGIPASVTGSGPNPHCRPVGDNESTKTRNGPASAPATPPAASGWRGGFGPGSPFQTTAGADSDNAKAVALIIKPAGIPAGVGLEIYSLGGPSPPAYRSDPLSRIRLAVVQASPGCTGS